MKKTTPLARVQVIDRTGGLICTFSCKNAQAGEALLAHLAAQPENEAHQLQLLGPGGEVLQQWPPGPASRYGDSPVKSPQLYKLLQEKDAAIRASEQVIAKTKLIIEQTVQLHQRTAQLHQEWQQARGKK